MPQAPIVSADDAGMDADFALSTPESIGAFLENRPHILVVEDEPVFRRVVARFLRREGCSVAEAASISEARSMLTAKPPRAVLLDKNLPDGSGLDLISAIREASALAVIVILTGYPSTDSVQRADALDIDQYLVKPVSLDTIRANLGLQMK